MAAETENVRAPYQGTGTSIDIVGGQQGYGGGNMSSAAGGAAAGAAAGTAIMPGWGTAIGAGVGLLGGIFANNSAKKAAAEQRSWEEMMSNTAHRREVRDLYAAGLNPILSATGGAGSSTPSSSAAPVVDLGAATLSGAAAGQKNVIDRLANIQALENVAADTQLKKDTSTNTKVLSDKAGAEANNARIQGKILKEELTQAQGSAVRARNIQDIDETTLGKVLTWIDRISRSLQGAGNSAGAIIRDRGR